MVVDIRSMGLGVVRPPRSKQFFELVGVSEENVPPAWGRNNWPIVLGENNTLGTCVPVAACNAVMAMAAQTGRGATIPEELPVQIYSTVGPYRGTPETDIGMDPLVLFDWWSRNDIVGWQLKRWYDIDPTDEWMVREFIVSRGSVFAVQQLNVAQESQEIWSASDGPEIGLHATSYNRYDGDLSWCACWGKEQGVDYSFFSAQVLDVYGLDLVPV